MQKQAMLALATLLDTLWDAQQHPAWYCLIPVLLEPHTCSQEPQFDYPQSVLSPSITSHLLLLLFLPRFKYFRILFKTVWHYKTSILNSGNSTTQTAVS